MDRLWRLYAEGFGGLQTSRALRGSLLLMKDVILEKRRGFRNTWPVGLDFLECVSSSGRCKFFP